MLNQCFDDVLHLLQGTTPALNHILQDFNALKKKVKELGLDYKSIHYCSKGCMMYYKDVAHLMSCKFCGSPILKAAINDTKAVL